MRIVVLVKQVPQLSQVLWKSEGELDRQGSLKELNPADKCALLHAAAAAGPADTVTALTMGPQYAEDVLREAVSFGAGAGVLLADPLFAGSDTYATAKILAAALERLSPDLILCGRRSVDGETGQVGPELAVRLDVSCLTNVLDFYFSDGGIVARRLTAESVERLWAPLPAVVTVTENLDVAALPSLSGLRRAAAAAFPCWDAALLGLAPSDCGLPGSRTRVTKVYAARTGARRVRFYDPAAAGGVLLERLGAP